MRFLVTGTAGFIGFHVARRLLDEGHEVTGIDGFTPYYDVNLKKSREAILAGRNRYESFQLMLEDFAGLENIWKDRKFDAVIHLAGQAGVRYSIENPRAYIDSNVTGTFNLLELSRSYPVGHFMLASTSSLYTSDSETPSAETDRTDHPVSLYAASKKSTELMSHSYSHMFGLPVTAFRFFTVYGPWGRPDMAFFKFVHNILGGHPIDVYNNGNMKRDFTYIDDLVEAIWRLLSVIPRPREQRDEVAAVDSISPIAPWRVVNIGGGAPVPLMEFIAKIEAACGRKAICNFMPMQQGDVRQTCASPQLLQMLTGYQPATRLSEGIAQFVAWYREHYACADGRQSDVEMTGD